MQPAEFFWGGARRGAGGGGARLKVFLNGSLFLLPVG